MTDLKIFSSVYAIDVDPVSTGNVVSIQWIPKLITKASWRGRTMKEFSQLSVVVLLVAAYEGSHAERREDIKSINSAAENGNTRAQLKLGFRYRFGIGVSMDHEQSAQWYFKAAKHGHSGAQTIVGLMYSLGEGLPQDYGKAEEWLRKAAAQGDAEAQLQLELLLESTEKLEVA